MSQSKKQACLALVLMAFAVGVFYWRIWTPRDADRAYFEGDIFEKDFPARAAWVRSVREGIFPFWNAYEFGGWPALANCEAGILYPPNWLLVLSAPGGRLTFYHLEALVLLHFVFAGWFLFLLARQYRLSFWPAVLAALIYMFCGFHGGHKLHVNLFCTIIWFPLILYFVERALERGRSLHFFSAALFLGVAYLAGHPQMAFYLTLLLALRLAWEFPADRKTTGSSLVAAMCLVGRAAWIFLPAVALAAAQLFPALELFEQGARAGGGRYDFAVEYSLPPQELVEFLLPEAFGWYFIEVFYVGVWAWLLAWVALRRDLLECRSAASANDPALRKLRFRTPDSISNPATGASPVECRSGASAAPRTYWIAILAGALLLALGRFAGLLPSLYGLFPVLGRMRAPSRWLYFVDMAVAVLAGFGLQGLLENAEDVGVGLAKRLQRLVRWLLVGLALVLLYFYKETMMPYPQVHLENLQGLIGALVFVAVVLAVGWLLLVLYRGGSLSATALGVCFCLLVFVDLARYNNQINVVTERKAYPQTPVAQTLRQRLEGERFRYWQLPWRRQLANGNIFGLEEAGGLSPLVPARYARMLERAQQAHPGLLRLMGIRYFVGEVPAAVASEATVVQAGLWEIGDVFPRAFAVEDFVYLRRSRHREALLVSVAWDDARFATVDEPPEGVAFQPAPIGTTGRKLARPLLVWCGGRVGVHSGGSLFLDGQAVVENAPGCVLAVLDTDGSEVERLETFENPGRAKEFLRLVEFVRDVPEGRVVIGTLAGEGPTLPDPDVVQALQSLGLDFPSPAMPLPAACAFVGVKGAPPGSALEAVSEREAILVLGSRGERFGAMTAEGGKARPKPVEIPQWRSGRLRLLPEGSGQQFIVVTEKDYPGWRARREGGAPVALLQADLLFLGMVVEGDAGEVELRFLPTLWWLWAAVSLAALGGIGVGMWRTRQDGSASFQGDE